MVFCSIILTIIAVKTAHANISSNDKELEKNDLNSQNIVLLDSPLTVVDEDNIQAYDIEEDVLVAATSLHGVGGPDIVTPSSDQISLHVVKEGDTLSEIADMFSVSVNTIKWANNISTLPKEGEVLVILPVSGVKHSVKEGDTLTSIAKKYNGKEEDIAKYNGLSLNTTLSEGEEIIIPNGEIVAPKPKPKATPAPAPKTYSAPSLPDYSGQFMRPLSGGVKTQGIHGNNAVDIASPIGTPLRSIAPGRVIVARIGGWNGGYGNYVVVAHDNGVQSLYAHMNTVGVSVGQNVAQGQNIGTVGSSGNSTGPHVHFEIRGAINPF